MKLIACGLCADMLAMDTEWRSCKCGNAKMRWDNPHLGTVLVDSKVAHRKDRVFIIGLNNRLLVPALQGELGMFQDFREAHDRATDSPNHVFDKSRANCWAVVARVGTTSDVKWWNPEAES